MRHRFQTEQWLPYPSDRVFAFFANPANLPPLMPEWQQARIEKTVIVPPPSFASRFAAGKGSWIMISFRPLPFIPLRLEWDAYIDELQWNEFFCDEQKKGPFR